MKKTFDTDTRFTKYGSFEILKTNEDKKIFEPENKVSFFGFGGITSQQKKEKDIKKDHHPIKKENENENKNPFDGVKYVRIPSCSIDYQLASDRCTEVMTFTRK